MASAGPVPKAGCGGCQDRSTKSLSLWKNEGKNPQGEPVKGGLEALDTLYDFETGTDRIPPLSEPEDKPPGEPPAPSDIRPVSILDEMKRSYLDYAMSVIVARALPDARDGLKPVHRRILYAMYENGFEWNKPYRKSARTVGDVIGKYHPHGDQSVYDAMVRMAQEFSMRVPLIDGQGNFGSVDGDMAAAMRYTESRLTKIAQSLLDDIDKDTVDYPGQLRRFFPGTAGAAGQIPEPAGQWRRRHRGRHGHQYPAAQSRRGDRCLRGADRQSRARHRRPHQDRSGAGFSDRRHHPRPPGHPLGLSSRPRLDRDARQGIDRHHPQGPRSHHHHRNSLPDEQGHDGRADRRAAPREERSTALPICATNPTATAFASWSN